MAAIPERIAMAFLRYLQCFREIRGQHLYTQPYIHNLPPYII